MIDVPNKREDWHLRKCLGTSYTISRAWLLKFRESVKKYECSIVFELRCLIPRCRYRTIATKFDTGAVYNLNYCFYIFHDLLACNCNFFLFKPVQISSLHLRLKSKFHEQRSSSFFRVASSLGRELVDTDFGIDLIHLANSSREDQGKAAREAQFTSILPSVSFHCSRGPTRIQRAHPTKTFEEQALRRVGR